MGWITVAALFLVVTAASGGAGFFYKKISLLHKTEGYVSEVLFIAPVLLCVLFAALASISGWQFNLVNFVCGIAGGICFSMAVAMLLFAVAKGDYSVSVIIINLSFFIPIVLSAIFLRETIEPLQIAGIFLLLAVIVFSNLNIKKKPQAEIDAEVVRNKKSNAWVAYALLACLFNGLVNFSLKVQQHFSPQGGQDTFYFVMYAVSFLIGAALYLAKGARTVRQESPKIPLCSAGLGACVAFNYYPMSFLAGKVNSALLFGVATAGGILMSLLAGWIFFHEKVTAKSIASILCCIAAIALQIISI